MEDQELEFVLLNIKEMLVYQIPPASSSSGHKADDWKNCIWRGRCQVAGRGKDLLIKLLDAQRQLFAQCNIPNGDHERYVERTLDSSRYFVLKITNGNKHAFIGIGFQDRNDAFDFNCTLNDFKATWVERASVPTETEASQVVHKPSKDFTLKEGQKIKIQLKSFGADRTREERAQTSDSTTSGGFGALAPPPGPGGSSRRQRARSTAEAPPAASASMGQYAPQAAPVASPASPSAAPRIVEADASSPSDCGERSEVVPPLVAQDTAAAGISALMGQMQLGGSSPTAPAAATQLGAPPAPPAPQPALMAQPASQAPPAAQVTPPQQQAFGAFDGGVVTFPPQPCAGAAPSFPGVAPSLANLHDAAVYDWVPKQGSDDYAIFT